MANIVKVLNSGLDILTELLAGGSDTPKYIGFGTGTTAPVAADVDLEAAAQSRVEGTPSQTTTNVANDTFTVQGTIVCAGGEKAITEVALFDAETGGSAFVRATFGEINLNDGDSITFTFNNVFEEKVV
jgi:hypothetical protein